MTQVRCLYIGTCPVPLEMPWDSSDIHEDLTDTAQNLQESSACQNSGSTGEITWDTLDVSTFLGGISWSSPQNSLKPCRCRHRHLGLFLDDSHLKLLAQGHKDNSPRARIALVWTQLGGTRQIWLSTHCRSPSAHSCGGDKVSFSFPALGTEARRGWMTSLRPPQINYTEKSMLEKLKYRGLRPVIHTGVDAISQSHAQRQAAAKNSFL